MTRPDGAPLQVRCGVNTGEALVRLDVTPGSGEGFLTGDAVNTAARLQAAAPPGGVAVGASPTSRPSAPSSMRRYRRSRPRARRSRCSPGAPCVRWRAPACARAGSRRHRSSDAKSSSPPSRRDGPRLGDGRGPRRPPRRRARHRQEPPGARVRALPRRAPGDGHLEAGALPALRRGGHLLGPGRDRQGARGHPRLRRRRRPSSRSSTRRCPRARRARGCGSACVRCSALRRRRPHARRTSPPGRASSSWSRPPVPRCWSWRTCTGPARPCSRSSSTCCPGLSRLLSSSSPRRGPSCWSATRGRSRPQARRPAAPHHAAGAVAAGGRPPRRGPCRGRCRRRPGGGPRAAHRRPRGG